jgi:hypothetical protein
LWEGDPNKNTDFPREVFRHGFSRFSLGATRKNRFHFQESGSYGRTDRREYHDLPGEDLPEGRKLFGCVGEPF